MQRARDYIITHYPERKLQTEVKKKKKKWVFLCLIGLCFVCLFVGLVCEKSSVFLISSDNSSICFPIKNYAAHVLPLLPYTIKSQLSLPGIFSWCGMEHMLWEVCNDHSNRCMWLNITPNKQKNISQLFLLITFPMEIRSSWSVFVFSKQWLIIFQPPLLQVFKTREFQWPKCFISGAVCREVLLSHQTSIFQGKYQISLCDLIVSINSFEYLYKDIFSYKLKLLYFLTCHGRFQRTYYLVHVLTLLQFQLKYTVYIKVQ